MGPQPSAAREGAFQLLQGSSRFLVGQDLSTPHCPVWSVLSGGRCEDRSRSSERMPGPAAEAQTRLCCVHVSRRGRVRAPPWTPPCLSTPRQWTVGTVESRPREQSTQDLCCRPVSIFTECLHGTLLAHQPHLAFQTAPQPGLHGPSQPACGPHQGWSCTWGSPMLGRMLSCHHRFEIPKN